MTFSEIKKKLQQNWNYFNSSAYNANNFTERLFRRIKLLDQESVTTLSKTREQTLFIKRDRQIACCPPLFSSLYKASPRMYQRLSGVRSRFTWMSWQIEAHISPIAPKVDAPMMSADMYMNNVTSACVRYLSRMYSDITLHYDPYQCLRYSGIRIFRADANYIICFQVTIKLGISHLTFFCLFH